MTIIKKCHIILSVLLSRFYSGTVEVIDGFCSFNFLVDNIERNTGDDSKTGGLDILDRRLGTTVQVGVGTKSNDRQ